MILAFLALLAASLRPAAACVCLEPTSVRKARADADAVFAAEVIEVRPTVCSTPGRGCSRAAYAELRVLRSWKGLERERPRVTVFLPDPEACGSVLEAQRLYLVYAGFEPPRNWASAFGSPTHAGLMSVSTCSRTAPLEQAVRDLGKLGRPEWAASDRVAEGSPDAAGVPAPAAPEADWELRETVLRLLIARYDGLEPQFDDPVGRRYCIAFDASTGSSGRPAPSGFLARLADHPAVHPRRWCRWRRGRVLSVGPIEWLSPTEAGVWSFSWIDSRPGGVDCLHRATRTAGGWEVGNECERGAIYN